MMQNECRFHTIARNLGASARARNDDVNPYLTNELRAAWAAGWLDKDASMRLERITDRLEV